MSPLNNKSNLGQATMIDIILMFLWATKTSWVSAIPQATNSRGLPLPHLRYQLWSSLGTPARQSAGDLRYTQSTWNTPGTNSRESAAFGSLSAAEQTAAATFGLGEESWDCWINHYEGYDWDDLTSEGVAQYLQVLGWDRDSWDGDDDPPSSDDEWWADLTLAEQSAAGELCYFQEL